MPALRRLCPLLLLLSLAACAHSRAASTGQAKAEVEAALAHYAELTRSGPLDGLVDLFTPDGELLEAGMASLAGRQAIHDFLAPLVAQFEVSASEMHAEVTDIHGSIGYQWGTFAQTAGPKGGTPSHYAGRFVAEWHRGDDGAWRLRRLLMQPGGG
ncbi:MAG TPA: nuclear transport factor 2 family protein [Thermoanaerobaculia bacterium]|nr:nuclear transport factor 2 family protein [Thermoanaerobaculia bacterium]